MSNYRVPPGTAPIDHLHPANGIAKMSDTSKSLDLLHERRRRKAHEAKNRHRRNAFLFAPYSTILEQSAQKNARNAHIRGLWKANRNRPSPVPIPPARGLPLSAFDNPPDPK